MTTRDEFAAELGRLPALALRLLDELDLARGHGADPAPAWHNTRAIAGWVDSPEPRVALMLALMHSRGFVARTRFLRNTTGYARRFAAWRLSPWAETRGRAPRLTTERR